MVSYSTNKPMGQGDEIPLFQQVAQRVCDDIVDGSLEEGSQVPSINEFAAFWRINPATALKGITLLVAEGTLCKRRGIGTFVAEGARDRLLERRRREFAARFVTPLLSEAALLGLTRDQIIEQLTQEEE